ncbi:MAG: pilus assembly protein [Proteobacteria bacterium]|nr:pilus assembly protein [Pseudomonadota bacterium]
MTTFAHCRRGSAGIETAFALPVLLFLGFAAADAGWLLAERHRMKSGLAAATHYLARSRDVATSEDKARNLAVTGQTASGGAARVKGWTPGEVSVSYRLLDNSGGAYAGGDQVRVVRLESDRPYQGFGMLGLVGVGPVRVHVAHEERWTGG